MKVSEQIQTSKTTSSNFLLSNKIRTLLPPELFTFSHFCLFVCVSDNVTYRAIELLLPGGLLKKIITNHLLATNSSLFFRLTSLTRPKNVNLIICSFLFCTTYFDRQALVTCWHVLNILQKIALSLVKSRLAVGSVGCLFVCLQFETRVTDDGSCYFCIPKQYMARGTWLSDSLWCLWLCFYFLYFVPSILLSTFCLSLFFSSKLLLVLQQLNAASIIYVYCDQYWTHSAISDNAVYVILELSVCNFRSSDFYALNQQNMLFSDLW